jgi:hypothetical protein
MNKINATFNRATFKYHHTMSAALDSRKTYFVLMLIYVVSTTTQLTLFGLGIITYNG